LTEEEKKYLKELLGPKIAADKRNRIFVGVAEIIGALILGFIIGVMATFGGMESSTSDFVLPPFGFVLLLVAIALLVIGIISIVRAILRKPRIEDQYNQQIVRNFSLSDVYRTTASGKMLATRYKLNDFVALLGCNTCKFADQQKLQNGVPWCQAGNQPDIENKYCYTRQPKE
jgi:hypothetical protein